MTTILGVMAIGWTHWPQPDVGPDIGAEARKWLRSQKAVPLDGPLQTVLEELDFVVEPQDHPLLGQPAPGFTLPTAAGARWTLPTDPPSAPIVIVFYYGYDCDHCVAQLFGLSEDYEQFRRLDAQVVAISPDAPSRSREQIDKHGGFRFPLLADEDLAIAKQYHVDQKTAVRKLPHHATFIVDAKGIVRWVVKDHKPFIHNPTLFYELTKLTDQLPAGCKPVAQRPPRDPDAPVE